MTTIPLSQTLVSILVLFLSLGSSWAQQQECADGDGTCLGPPGDEDATSSPLLPDESDSCADLHPMCDAWAQHGECLLNPKYMLSACQESCHQCVNVTKLKEEGADEATIRHKQLLRYMNAGVAQSLGETDEEKQNTKQAIVEMGRYLRGSSSDLDLASPIVRAHCRNNRDVCAYWASVGECEKSEHVEYLMLECALACQFCHHLETFHSCRDRRPDKAKPVFEPGDVYKLLQGLLGKGDESSVRLLTPPVSEENDAWVLGVDDFLTSDECDRLLALSAKIGYDESSPMRNDRNEAIRRNSQSAVCQTNGECDHDDLYQTVLSRISELIGIPKMYFEPLEFILYPEYTPERGVSSYGVHHDYRFHDIWKPSGVRVLSFVVSLSEVQEGGATGFPNLDWLSIPPRKGQLLLWPNVLSSDPSTRHKDTASEGLPPIRGDKYAAYGWIRMYEYARNYGKDCV